MFERLKSTLGLLSEANMFHHLTPTTNMFKIFVHVFRFTLRIITIGYFVGQPHIMGPQDGF